jgi:hypothetical protein
LETPPSGRRCPAPTRAAPRPQYLPNATKMAQVNPQSPPVDLRPLPLKRLPSKHWASQRLIFFLAAV